MAETGILTSQYVHIELPVASVADRILAQIVDYLAMAAYSAAAVWLLVEANIGSFWLMGAVWMAPIVFYSLFCETVFRGQTLGKMALKTRVVTTDGRQPSLGDCLMRWVLWLVDGPTLSYLGLLVIVLTRNNQRLGDLAAGTVVVKMQDIKHIHVSLDDYDFLSNNYAPRYAAAADLSLEQVDTIRRTLVTNTPDQPERVKELAEKVRLRLGITPGEPTATSFLQRIVSDYQYYALEELP